MQNLYVWVVQPPDYPHSRCFAEVADSISQALDIPQHWGYQAPSAGFVRSARPIILGAHLLPPMGMYGLPHNSYVYNLEVIGDHTPIPYLDLLRNASVWDYSLRNIEKLKSYDINAKHCPIGYHACLDRIAHAEVRDIDVLFYGSFHERREKVIRELIAADVKAVWVYNAYGKERDDLIARSKIVLNMHYYEYAPFEIVRCSYLFSNKVCVVSENSEDFASDFPYRDSLYFCDYGEIVATCLRLLESSEKRDSVAQTGYDKFTKTSMEANLRAVL